jgi:hypothetical protein
MPSRPRPIRSPSPLAHEAGHVGIGDTLNPWERLHGVHGSLEAMGGLAPMGHQVGNRLAAHGDRELLWLPLAWCTAWQRCPLKQGSCSQASNSALLE